MIQILTFCAVVILGGLIVAALDTLNQNVADLKTKVEAFIASKQGGATETQVQAAADAVAVITSEVPAV
jgi:hypothetical protein